MVEGSDALRIAMTKRKACRKDGRKFHLSESGVWLTEFEPCEYISLNNKG